jgi:hypothetical protein
MASDNNFSKAKDLGLFSAAQGLRGLGDLGPKDKVDVVKFTISAPTAFTARSSFKAKGGNLNVSFFYADPLNGGAIVALPGLPTQTFQAGKRVKGSFPITASPVPITVYVKFDKPTQDLKYNFSFKPSL